METVIVIGNCNPKIKYYKDNNFVSQILLLRLRPIFMYDADYMENATVDLDDNDDYEPSMYHDHIAFSQKNKDSIVKLLKPINVIAVIPDGDDSVLDSDYFSNQLNIISNPIETTKCRRDKYDMQEQIKKFGLTSIQQKKCKKISDILEFVSNHPNIRYVIKPDRGAATETTYLCNNSEMLVEKFNIIMKSDRNQADLNDKCCLVQEYLDGEEWIVNTASRHGSHKIINVMKYNKSSVNGLDFTYLETVLIEPKEVPNELLIYSTNVLNALQIENGAAHSEIKMSSKGPCLIEVGSRVGGGQNREYLLECIRPTSKGLKYNQSIATVYAYCNQSLFDTIPDQYTLNKVGATVFCSCPYDNILWKDVYFKDLLNRLSKIVIVKDITNSYKEDELVKKTVDFYTDLIDFDIISEDEENLEKAIHEIRVWEENIENIAKEYDGISNPAIYFMKKNIIYFLFVGFVFLFVVFRFYGVKMGSFKKWITPYRKHRMFWLFALILVVILCFYVGRFLYKQLYDTSSPFTIAIHDKSSDCLHC